MESSPSCKSVYSNLVIHITCCCFICKRVNDTHEKDVASGLRWVLVTDPVDQHKKLLQAWDESDASHKYLVFNVVNKEVKLESEREYSVSSVKVTADLLSCRICAEQNAAITVTDNGNIDADK